LDKFLHKIFVELIKSRVENTFCFIDFDWSNPSGELMDESFDTIFNQSELLSLTMGSIWRSEDMSLIQIVMQREAAHETVGQLGKTGLVQFLDVYHQNAF
jgi:hypothetical protein